MESKNTKSKVKEQEQPKLIDSINMLKNLISDYFIKKFLNYMHERKRSEIIRYNKSIQRIINIDINNYKEYSEKYSSIEIEIIPMKDKYGKFIYIEEEDKKYYHIYLMITKKKKLIEHF